MNIIGIPTTGSTTAKHNVIQRSLAGLSPYTMAKWMSLVFGFTPGWLPHFLSTSTSVSLFLCLLFVSGLVWWWWCVDNYNSTQLQLCVLCWFSVECVESWRVECYNVCKCWSLLFVVCCLLSGYCYWLQLRNRNRATCNCATSGATSNEQRATRSLVWF